MLTSITLFFLILLAINTCAVAWLASVMLCGNARVDLRMVARRIADELLADFDATGLDRQGTDQFVRTRYMQLVTRHGLPEGYAQRVANMVWGILQQAEGDTVEPTAREFSFYN